jgi:UDP-N-acetylmuramate dehydrogenase
MDTHKNYSLKDLNTFGIDALASNYIEVESTDQLKEAILQAKNNQDNLLILGGGSNILFKSDFKGTVIHPKIELIEIVIEDEHSTVLKVGAGVEWDSLVDYTVKKGLYGLENLSLIPGSVGASPIQNIGAYGVEAKDSIEQVEGIYIDSLSPFTLSNSECKFGYRDSIFKNKRKGQVVITYVFFKLRKQKDLVTHYGNLDAELERLGGKTLENVRKAVIDIRNSKLPDPKILGNAGSFFKNPVVDISLVDDLQKKYDKVPFYPVNDDFVKLPAGWLIEKSGWKGKRIGNVGVHKDQALVIVNYGNATGSEVVELAHQVRQSVMELFNVSLEMEVNVI